MVFERNGEADRGIACAGFRPFQRQPCSGQEQDGANWFERTWGEWARDWPRFGRPLPGARDEVCADAERLEFEPFGFGQVGQRGYAERDGSAEGSSAGRAKAGLRRYEEARMSCSENESVQSGAPRRLIVAIDGPAGAGKSTVARHLASHFGLLNLESGAMYRAFALKALRAGVSLEDSSALEQLAHETDIRLEAGAAENRVLLDGEDVTGQLRNPLVTDAASRVSVYPPIRAWMVRLQQQMGAHGGVIMEGRDIGTVVFPHADAKIFLDAAPEVRGMRRFDQLGDKNAHPPEDVIRELRERDYRDRNRADSPLRPASDAILLDSTEMTLEQAVKAAEDIVAAKVLLQNSAVS